MRRHLLTKPRGNGDQEETQTRFAEEMQTRFAEEMQTRFAEEMQTHFAEETQTHSHPPTHLTWGVWSGDTRRAPRLAPV